MVFQLVNLDSKESFALWDKTNNRVLRQVEGVANIDDLKFMKADLFAQRYPNLGKMNQVVREIIIPVGSIYTQYSFGFKKTADDDLKLAMLSCRNLGINPLEVEFTLRRIGKGFDTSYSVVAGKRVGIPQDIVHPQASLSPQQPPTSLEQANVQYHVQQVVVEPKGFVMPIKAEEESPSLQELDVIRWANEYADKLSEEDYIAGFQHSLKQQFNQSITDERARKWFKQFYSNK